MKQKVIDEKMFANPFQNKEEIKNLCNQLKLKINYAVDY